MTLRSFLLLVLVCGLWAGNMIVSRLVVDRLGVPPLWFAALRSVIVMLVLGRWLWPLPAGLARVMLVTFAISGAGFALMFVGLQDATPSAASIVGLSGAPLTVIFAVAVLGERVHWRRALGIALSFAGVAVSIASPAAWNASAGLAFVFASAVAGALGAVFLKRIELGARRLQAWAGASSALVLVPLSLAFEHGQLHETIAGGWPLLLGLAYSALAVSVVAHTLYFKLLQTHDANAIAPFTLMTPVFTVMLGATITDDPVGPWLVTGGMIAAAGVLVILVRPSRKVFKPLLVRSRL